MQVRTGTIQGSLSVEEKSRDKGYLFPLLLKRSVPLLFAYVWIVVLALRSLKAHVSAMIVMIVVA